MTSLVTSQRLWHLAATHVCIHFLADILNKSIHRGINPVELEQIVGADIARLTSPDIALVRRTLGWAPALLAEIERHNFPF